MNMELVVGLRAAATVARRSPSGLLKLIERGQLSGDRDDGGGWVFERQALEALSAKASAMAEVADSVEQHVESRDDVGSEVDVETEPPHSSESTEPSQEVVAVHAAHVAPGAFEVRLNALEQSTDNAVDELTFDVDLLRASTERLGNELHNGVAERLRSLNTACGSYEARLAALEAKIEALATAMPTGLAPVQGRCACCGQAALVAPVACMACGAGRGG